jgi:site-specific recombinase XerD
MEEGTQITPTEEHALATQDALSILPEESVWLANFISPQTKRTYSVAVREFIRFHGFESREALYATKPAHLIAWREHLLKNGATAKTVRSRLAAVSSLFKHLCEHQLVPRNPAQAVKRPTTNQQRVEAPVLTAEQVRTLLELPDNETLKGKRDSAILHLLFYTGCRAAEVTTLKVRDFFEDGGYWVVDFRIKGGRRNRVAIHHELRRTLREYLDAAGHRDARGAPFFLSVRDTTRGLSSRDVHRLFTRYARKAELPVGVRPHSARATFITEALERKCPIESVQESVGHRHISTTKMYDKRKLSYRESASFVVQY